MNNSLNRSCFAHRLAVFGDQTALKSDTESVSYSDLSARVDAFSKTIGDKHSLVVAEMDLSVDCIVTYLAALKSGNPVILTSPDDEKANTYIAEVFKADIYFQSDGRLTIRNPAERKHSLHPELALLLSTSGSTGGAKLVRLSYSNIQSNAEAIVQYLHLTRDDVGALTLPLYYSYGLSILNSHLSAGGSLYLSTLPPNHPDFIKSVDDAGCTNLSGVPYSYEIFERTGLRSHRFKSLRFMTAAGGRLPPETVLLYANYMASQGGEFFVMYGQTEAAPRIAYLPPDLTVDNADCIGVAIPNGELVLYDDSGNPVIAAHTAGELVYRGPNVMMGYALTASELQKGVELDELHTGDIGERTDNGLFRIIGRKSRFSKLAGVRISHDDIERRLRESGIECAVTGNDARLVVGVNSGCDESAVTNRVMDITGLTSSLIKVIGFTEIPRLANGKTDFRAINAAAVDDSGNGTDSVLDAFKNAFWPRPVTAEDSFVSLGGDSLTFVILSVALGEVLGELPKNWENLNISQLESRASAIPPEKPPDPLKGSRASSRSSLFSWSLLDPNIYLRTIAITMIVLHHLSPAWGIKGGAYVLMTLVGYSIARFQSPSLFAGRLRGITASLLKNLLLYYIVLAILFALTRDVRWPELFLVSNIIGDSKPALVYNAYWFVEAYAVIVSSVILCFSIPVLRRALTRHPFEIGIAILPASVLLLLLGRMVWLSPWHACYEGDCNPFPEVAFWASIGWCLYFANTTFRKILVLGLAALIINGIRYWSSMPLDATVLFFVVAFALITWKIELRVPRSVSSIFSFIAVNSYTIYLVHLIPMYFFAVEFEIYFPDNTTRSLVWAIPVTLVSLLGIFVSRKTEKFVQKAMAATRQ
jgi:acyl-CoA synthetase (AMP-forming)/AMP-acid ligase II